MRLAKLSLFAILALAPLLPGCMAGVYPGGPTLNGGIYSNVGSPAQHLAVATDAATTSGKRGEATNRALFGLFAWGDAGVEAAIHAAGITRVHHVDHDLFIVLFGLYATDTTIVYGE